MTRLTDSQRVRKRGFGNVFVREILPYDLHEGTGDVALPFRQVDVLDALLDLRVGDDDHPPGLLVAAGRGPARRFQHAFEHVGQDGVGPELAESEEGANGVVG